MQAWARRTRIAVAWLVATGAWALFASVRVAAQVQTNQFVPLDRAKPPELSPAPLLYGAYAFVWGAVIVYVYTLWRRLGRVERDLSEVTAKLANTRRT